MNIIKRSELLERERDALEDCKRLYLRRELDLLLLDDLLPDLGRPGGSEDFRLPEKEFFGDAPGGKGGKSSERSVYILRVVYREIDEEEKENDEDEEEVDDDEEDDDEEIEDKEEEHKRPVECSQAKSTYERKFVDGASDEIIKQET
ncbi:hypothetical protein FQA39_LY08505 [Lamprigera yunnana]|nr:hypothetical protein FQA39_LY08505 [Lamprigera yunnana]